ncbi:MAG TPA: tRNA (N(6)-L-threonylcarbamoyladenosine(37)-C(2))-methylthiotransferase MtaB [Fimbriimonadaceae bacterium]|nr:tRNA (N(6)-L-threonylcarbamoyladenosine(37)-C(2))-methylthiotransferase MtaB [Fimbriimonadaceae bacterium]HRJ96382.1 tRNA (N(6)-L-threonylcarbamoyladenosine(37)-C(2))-methylthiotransferase MtaB [Fimbriimonadaceae bacterium]
MPTAAFTTLGCKVNQYETQRILESFEEGGYDIVPFEGPADVYVINTCSVTGVAESKSRYMIRRAARWNPEAKVVVTGCAAQMAVNKKESLDGAALVVPNPEKLDTFDKAVRSGVIPLPQTRRSAERTAIPSHSRTRATLKVQDGCTVMCSYCSIPYTRPGLVSRPSEEVIAEADALVARGYRELVLTGVLIGAYGPESGSGGPDFEELVERLCRAVPGVRIRISSIELRQVTDRLIDLLAGGLVVPHLHIPLQSGDDGVLADMNRPYTQADYLRTCETLYERVPEMSITADVMVGFPTETEERFATTLRVCREARYLKSHVFRFSPRYGTPADRFGDPIPAPIKQRRAQEVAEIGQTTAAVHIRRFLGRTLRVLVENKVGRDGLMGGLTDNYIEVRFPAPTSWANTFVTVRLDEERDGVAYGEAVVSSSLRML